MSLPSVTLIIPTIAPRQQMFLHGCTESVMRQTHLPDVCMVVLDRERRGVIETRNRGLAATTTDFVAFLDDDDLIDPTHLQHLLEHQVETDADFVYSWGREGVDGPPLEHPIPRDGSWVNAFGIPWDSEFPDILRKHNFIPITSLIRTELAKEVGGFTCEPMYWDNMGNRIEFGERIEYRGYVEEWQMQVRLLDSGAKFSHLPEITWTLQLHSWNSAGDPGNVPGWDNDDYYPAEPTSK